ncbi:hypothetical protein [Spirosoma sp. KNUC1025]|uniref:hypothetical protein n=1 Tax=Spirosoma sp. KNUC1025 TaxID=2894082 RepID=UPI00386C57C5
MKKTETTPIRFESLSEASKATGLPAPLHPLITLFNGVDKPLEGPVPLSRHVLSFYKISFRPYMGALCGMDRPILITMRAGYSLRLRTN